METTVMMSFFRAIILIGMFLCPTVFASDGDTKEVINEQQTVSVLPKGILCIDGEPQKPLEKGERIQIIESVKVRCAVIISHEFWKVRAIDSEGIPVGPSYFIKNPNPGNFK